MNTAPNLTVFGRQLKTCLEIHNLDIAQLAERTAIEKQRLDTMLNGTTDVSYHELAAIVDVFRIESSLLLSEETLPYDTYRVACDCNYTTAEPGFFRHLQMMSRRLQAQPDTQQSEHKKQRTTLMRVENPLLLQAITTGKL